MLEWSRCHTLDRANMRAQFDCNDATIAKLQEAIESIFRFDYWPYMHNSDTKTCMETLSLRSWLNISEDGAARMLATFGALVLAMAAYI